MQYEPQMIEAAESVSGASRNQIAGALSLLSRTLLPGKWTHYDPPPILRTRNAQCISGPLFLPKEREGGIYVHDVAVKGR